MDQYRADRAEVSVPVFTDPSGLRRRLVVMAGAGVSVLCVGALIVVGFGLFGGPKTPFTLWGAPPPSKVTKSPGPGGHHNGLHGDRAGSQSPGTGPTGAAPGSSPSPGGSGHPSPSADPTASPSPSPSPSPTGTRKSPPAYGHTKTPHPHPSHSRAAAQAARAAPYPSGWFPYLVFGPWR